MTDDFGLNMVPADYARSIHLSVRCSDYTQIQLPKRRESELNNCLAAIEALERIRTPRTQVVIDMNLNEGNEDGMICPQVCEDTKGLLLKVEEVVDTLTQRGLRASITYSPAWNE
jgi:hypothetical protein